MAKRLNYTIGVNADTSKFEASLQEAVTSLQALGTKSQVVPTLQKASTAALDLAKNLQSAVNTNTGKLDLSVFNKKLEDSGQSLRSYYNQMVQLGPAGTEAFLKVASSITQAELPLRRTNTLMNELWVTMKNTMRWQLTSSVLHGFVGSLEQAYGYSKNLDRSLNEIRIVSEKSAEDMARFAEQANKAAKALSTTTTNYTDASLIYYQQGLTDQEVLDRTETTIKMANVAGTTAETASQQLTAIWNNFYDGSQSLEHYADVMVKLGAATASSSDEISEGIEKFAAVANTVGLSYEYAASALATVTAQTRESASVVGTAFRTLFSRIQGLTQGETLDDGTTLNKYSQALATVGVQIKDTNGELKGMDEILDDLGSRWDTLAQDQKIALAETVAGVRQWTQLIALMDHWDFFKENLAMAQDADGALEQQAEIYAESWEAARDRTKAAAEDIYDSLINPDFYIKVDDLITPLLSGTADVIDAMGGMNGVLAASVLLINKVYGDKIAESLRESAIQIGFLTNQEQERARALQQQAATLAKSISIEKMGVEGPAREALDITQKQVELRGLVNSKIDELNERQKSVLQADLNHLQSLQEQSKEYARQITLNEELAAQYKQDIKDNISVDSKSDINRYLGGRKGSASSDVVKNAVTGVQDLISKSRSADEAIARIITRLESVSKKQVDLRAISNRIKSLSNDSDELSPKLKKVAYEMGGIKPGASEQEILDYFTDVDRQLDDLNAQSTILKDTLTNFLPERQVNLVVRFTAALKEGKSATEAMAYVTKEYEAANKEVTNSLETNAYATKDWADRIVSAGTYLSQLAMAMQAFKSIGNVFQDSDMTAGERLITIFTSLGMLLPTVITLTKAMTGATQLVTISEAKEVTVKGLGITASLAKAAADKILAKAEGEVATATAIANAEIVAGLIALAPYIALVAALGVAIYATVKAYNADADAAKEAAAGVEVLSKAYDDAKNAATELKNTINDWDSAVQSIDDLTEGTKEYADAIKTANDKAKELIESQGLFDRSKWYYDDKGIIQFADGVLEELQSQADARERQTESSLYTGQIYSGSANIKSERTNAKRSLIGDFRALSDNELDAAMSILDTQEPLSLDEFETELKRVLPGLELSTTKLEDFRTELETLITSTKDASDANDYYAKEILKNNIEENRSDALKDIAGDSEGIYNGLLDVYAAREAQALEERDQALSNVTVAKNKYSSNSALGSYIGQSINGDEELARLYASMVLGRTDVDQLNYKGGWNKGQLQTSSGENLFDEALSDDYMRKMIAQTYAQQELIDSLGEGLDNFDQDAYEASLQKLVDGANSLGDAFGEADFTTTILNQLAQGTESIDLSSLFAQLSPDDIAQLTGMSQEELYAALGLNEEDLATLGITDAEAWYNSFIASLNSYDPSSFYERLSQAATSGEKSARSLIDSIQSGDTTYENISDNEEYQNLIDQLDTLKSQYPELQADAIELSNTWEVGTQKFAEALEDVQDRLAQIKLDDLTNNAKEASDKLKDFLGEQESDWEVNIEANPKEFTNTMDELLDANYAVDVEIHTQAEQEFDSIKSAMQNIQDEASKIGENFVIAATDIRELNNTFPGIIQGMEDIGDGSVRLNQTMVESAIAAARGEVAADGEATVSRLENQATLLRAKQQVYQQMATAAAVLAGAETDSAMTSSEAQATLSGGLSDLEQLNSKASTTVKLDNQEKTADSAYDNGLVTAQNWDSAFSSAAQSSAEFARTAIANMQAVANNDAGAVTGGNNFGVKYTGSSGVSQEAAVLQDTQKMLDEADTVSEQAWADLAAKYQNLADSAGASANDIEGMIAQIGASTTNLDNLFSNISSGKGSKGGSGSKGKTYDKEDLKTLQEVEDRYHEINREIQKQDDLLDDLSNTTDRAWGTEALDGYENEIKALEKQQELYNQKLKEAQNYLVQDSALVKKYFADAQIGADGEITNYEDLLRENLNLYNAAVERYNLAVAGKTLSEEEHTALKNQLDAEKKLFEQRQKALEQYESTLDVVRDTTDNIQENARSIADKKLEEIKFKMEIVLDVKSMKDAVKDLSKEISEMFGDALTHGLESAKLSAGGAQAEAALLPNYQEEWNSLKKLYESTTDDADRRAIMDEIQSLQGNIVDSAKAIAEWANSIEDIIPDAVDAASERFAAFTEQLEHNTSVLDTIKELYTLQGVTYKTAEGFNRLQKNSQEKLNAQLASAKLQRGWYEQAAQRLEEAQAKLDSLGGDETDLRYDAYKKARDAYLEEFNKAQEAYLSSAQEAMETAQDMYLQQIEKAVYEFGQAVSNGVGLDLLQDKYDHYIEQNERYFDKVNEAYQVSAWYNKLQQDIDNTTNSAHKERLKALQEEINQRREGNKLSQYDLDILNAKYQVLQAQMALEDAQNAKNQIQLVRDSQGNWNYQYTADQDQIANAQQNLLDAENDWYNIAKQQVTDVTGEIVSTWKECQDKIKDIYSDMTLTDEERSAQAQEIYKYYSEKIKYLEEEKQNAIADMTEAGNKNLIDNAIITGDTITDLTGITTEELKQLVADSGESIADILMKNSEQLKEIAGNNTDLIDKFNNTYAKDLDDMTQNTTNFEDELRKLLDQAQRDFDNYKDKVQNVASETGTTLDNLAQETDKVSEATDQLRERGDEAKDTLWNMIDAAQNASDGYLELAQSIWDTVEALRALASQQAQFAASSSSKGNSSKGYDPNTDYSGVIMDGIANGWLEYGSKEYKELTSQRENKIDDMGLTKEYFGTRGDAADNRYKDSTSVGQYESEEEWKKKMQALGVPGFATGGYTGIFDDAKLAFLHQKELVLNQSDTENILAAVQAVRTIGTDLFKSIEKSLDGNAIAAMALMGQKLNPVATTPIQDSIEQTVHIDKVEFPNVTSRTEIEEAFISLTNDAAQWARRKT